MSKPTIELYCDGCGSDISHIGDRKQLLPSEVYSTDFRLTAGGHHMVIKGQVAVEHSEPMWFCSDCCKVQFMDRALADIVKIIMRRSRQYGEGKS